VAFKTFVDAVALPASDLNTYLMKQAVIVCTSGTRPSSPNEGMPIYETDTDKLLIYTTATTTWQPPWNLPWGYITTNTGPGSQTDYTAPANVLSITPTLLANRRYKLSGYLIGTQVTAGGTPTLKFLDSAADTIGPGGNSARLTPSGIAYVNTDVITATGFTLVSGSGAKTYNLQAQDSAGALRVATNAAMLLLEDIGPSGSPA